MTVPLTPLHEAGHATVAYLLGLATTEATVIRDGKNLGAVHFRDTNATFEADPAKARRLLVATLAGRAAVARLYRDAGNGCQDDDDRVWALARQLVGSDPAHAAEVALVVSESWDEARELVEDHAQAVTEVARELATAGTLRGEALARCVAEAVARDRASPYQQRQRDERRAVRRWLDEHAHGGAHHAGND